MLIEFRFGNYRSFRDEQTLSMVAARKDQEHPENCVDWRKERLVKMAAIYGANASGKSNLIRAAGVMREMVTSSVDTASLGRSAVDTFRLDPESRQGPSLFEMVFEDDGIQYRYGFVVSPERILEEWLYESPKASERRWFHRIVDVETGETDWQKGPSLKGQFSQLTEMTRPDALFLSVAAKFSHEQLSTVFGWFRRKLRIVTASTKFAPVTQRHLFREAEVAGEDECHMKKWIIDLMTHADVGIGDIKISEKEVKSDDVKFPEGMPVKRRKATLERRRKENRFSVEMVHSVSENGEEIPLDLKEESMGTQRLFELAGPWIESVLKNYVVLIDEFEASLHPLLARKLVEYFQKSRSKAQLIFATHDTTLLDPTLLRRDQVWFAEKDSFGASKLRPMSDFKPRKGEALQKGYLAGRYGAVPILDRFGVSHE